MKTCENAVGAHAAPGAARLRAARQLRTGLVILVQDSGTGVTYALASADRIDAFTLERLEWLAARPARLVLGRQLARYWDLHDGQSVDATTGIGDGRSAADRARTMRVTASGALRSALASPGHVLIETESNDATELGLVLASSGGARVALAASPMSQADGGYARPERLRQDPSLAHLVLEVSAGASDFRGPGGVR